MSTEARISLDEAVEIGRTGDLWLFRGSSAADRAIRVSTNSPVNHVGMAVVLDDLPPLMWHAEVGRSLPDAWSGTRHRGVQLHDLRDAVTVWAGRYAQRAWLRQLDAPVTPEMEDALLRTIARLDGTSFPSAARLAGRWLAGRLPRPSLRAPTWRGGEDETSSGEDTEAGESAGAAGTGLETGYCAEVVAVTYAAMGLLPADRKPNWYDPGRFWSGDELALLGGAWLSDEISVTVPPPSPAAPDRDARPRPLQRLRRRRF